MQPTLLVDHVLEAHLHYPIDHPDHCLVLGLLQDVEHHFPSRLQVLAHTHPQDTHDQLFHHFVGSVEYVHEQGHVLLLLEVGAFGDFDQFQDHLLQRVDCGHRYRLFGMQAHPDEKVREYPLGPEGGHP